jgi:hypothetical protein
MRTVALIARRADGKYIDPTTGSVIGCVGTDLERIVGLYRTIRDSNGLIETAKGKEVKLDEVRLLANATVGGELKATLHYHA